MLFERDGGNKINKMWIWCETVAQTKKDESKTFLSSINFYFYKSSINFIKIIINTCDKIIKI